MPQSYKFSSSKKHQGIELKESNTRANGRSGTRQVVVKPSVSGSNPRRAVFKVNSLFDYVAVGLCLPSIVDANSYEFVGNFHCYAGGSSHGTFLISNFGACFAHGNPRIQTDCKFAVGDSVSVEWDGARRRLRWAVLGTGRQHGLTLPSEYLQAPLHFAVEMSCSDVSLMSE